jgi:anti-sigma28 factor (negative regulator of flagellin synthesis)
MKVVDRNLSSGSPVESGRAQEVQRAGSTSGGTTRTQASGGDKVEFSNTLGSLARAMSTFNASRASKVQGLAAQYQKGNYQPDSLTTSRSMVTQALAPGAK